MPRDLQSYEVTAEPTLTGLIGWLRTQDPTTDYDYMSNGDCLLHRYLRTLVEMPDYYGVGGDRWYDAAGNQSPLPKCLDIVARSFPYTYGAALKRAEAVLSGEVVES